MKDRGGIREVIVDRKWPEIVKLMPLPKTCTNAGFSLKLLYQKYLLDYERVTEYGLPDIPPAEGKTAGMPIPDYLPENVALPDPFAGDASKKRKGRGRARDDGAASGGGGGGGGGDDEYEAGDDEGDGGGAGPTPLKSRATPAVRAAVATSTLEGGGRDGSRRELARALRRVELSLAVYENDAEVDWALAVLLVQSQKKLPVFARDPTRRLLDHLVSLLERCAALMEDPLVGFLLNSQSVPGSLRRQRLVVVLLNGLAVEENRRIMCASRRLFVTVLSCLHRVPVQQENDMETRANLFHVLEALSDSAKLQQPDAAVALAAVVGTTLVHGHGGLRLVALSILSKISRDRDNFALLVPCLDAVLVNMLVRMLGDALLQQSEAPGAENGLSALELCLDFIGSATADRALSERLLARTGLVRLLVMFLLSALDASAPRMYLKLLRKAVTALQNLCQHDATRALMVPFFNDFLKISCSPSALAPDVVPLLVQLN